MARWTRVNDLFHAALARPLSDRDAFLALECGDDGELRAEVESLLAAHDVNPASVATSAVSVGSRVGDYEVTGFLAAGAMGEVYRARDTKLGRDVALKILPAAFMGDSHRRARFEREARALAALNHPNIATIYGFEEQTDVVSGLSRTVRALVLELVEGETLADRIARGRVPVDEALSPTIQEGLSILYGYRAANVLSTAACSMDRRDCNSGIQCRSSEEDVRGAVH